MSLKKDIIKAKVESAKTMGIREEDIDQSAGSAIDIEAELVKEAVIKYLTSCNFTISQLKAPVIIENLKTPDQLVNIKLETMLGEYGPMLDTLKKIARPLGFESTIDQLESEIEKAVKPLVEGGASLVGLDLDKDDGKLEATGYVYIGEDPDSQNAFDVQDEDGQREFTTVQLKIEDARENE